MKYQKKNIKIFLRVLTKDQKNMFQKIKHENKEELQMIFIWVRTI
jgi:hypothetical protein